MTLHCELFWDDDIAVAGTALATTDAVGHDGEVDDIDGVLPNLRDVILLTYGDAGALADAKPEFSRYILKPTNWASTNAITGFVDGFMSLDLATENTTPVFFMGGSGGRPGGANFIQSYGRFDTPLSKSTQWCSGDSYLYSSIANQDTYLTLGYSYGQTYPYKGGKIQWVRKTADAVESAAEVWDNAFTSKLNTVSPGLDPSKQYILRGVGYVSKTAAKAAGAVRIRRETGAHCLIGGGAMDTSMGGTFFHWDGIPCTGNDAFTVETHAIVVETTAPEILMGFEEVGIATSVASGAQSGGLNSGSLTGGTNFGNIFSSFLGGR